MMKTSVTVWEDRRVAAELRARELGLQLLKFANRYGLGVAALVVSAVLGWSLASGVSDYTKGGWEMHVVQRSMGINIHFHHWYYGIPLGLIALLLIPRLATLSIFLFGLGASLSTHSFVNEGGIPSIIEGGPTLHVPFEVYLPAVTLVCALYAFFIIRREEWLARSREREELAISYIARRDDIKPALAQLDSWAKQHFTKKRLYYDRWTHIEYGYYRAVDRQRNGEWQLHYTASPFDEKTYALVLKLQHIPMVGRMGILDEWLEEIHLLLKPFTHPVLREDRFITIDVIEETSASRANV